MYDLFFQYKFKCMSSCSNLQSTVVPTKVRNKKKSKFNKMNAYNFTNPRKRTNNR